MLKKIIVFETALVVICAIILGLVLFLRGFRDTAPAHEMTRAHETAEAVFFAENKDAESAAAAQSALGGDLSSDHDGSSAAGTKETTGKSGSGKSFGGKAENSASYGAGSDMLIASRYEPLTFAVLGDSLSSPYSLESIETDAPKRLWWDIVAEYYNMELIAAEVNGGAGVMTNAGYTNEATSGLSVYRQLHSDRKPDIIFVLLGINDVFAQRPLNELSDNYRELLALMKAEYPDTRIFTFGYPLFTSSEKWNDEYYRFAAVNKVAEIASEYAGVDYIDLFDAEPRIEESYKYAISDDNMHANIEGQKLMAETAVRKLQKYIVFE